MNLEKQGYVNLVLGSNNSVHIELTEKVYEYAVEIEERHRKTLQLLFQDFSEEEIEQLFNLYAKLYSGIERVENYAKKLDEDENRKEK